MILNSGHLSNKEMKVISVEQMRKSDAYTIEHLVPGTDSGAKEGDVCRP